MSAFSLVGFARFNALTLAISHVLAFSAYSFLSWLEQNGSPQPPPMPSLDPTVVAALIGLGGIVAGALMTGGFAIHERKKNALLEKQRQKEQRRHDKEMEQFRRNLDKLARHEESDQQHQEAAQLAMLRAKTLEERVKAYRQSLLADPRIAHLQILDMTQPLEVTEIYVRLYVHQEEIRPAFRVDAEALEEKRYDPNVLLKRGRERLGQRVATARTPEEAIRTYKRCVIVGDPGAGKSTLLKHLTLLAGNQKFSDLPNLPIHIELNTFANSEHHDLLEFAATLWEERYSFPKTDALEYMQTLLQAGQALLLCDALDETVIGTSREKAEDSYRAVSHAITNVATRYPQSPVVVTARKAGYHQRTRLPGFTEVEVLDFRQQDSEQFVTRWFAIHPDALKRGNAPDLIARMKRSPRIQALAANPLLLSLIVLVYEDQLDLPERRAELYKQCVETLLSKWDASRNIRRLRAFKPEHKRQLLEEVAWHFHLQGQRYFSESELLQIIAQFLPAVDLSPEQNSQVLDEIAVENGLLKEQARGWHGFLHLTLQEYFVAQYAVDYQQLDVLLAKRDDPWWEEILLLYAGCIPDASPLFQRLLSEQNPQQGTQGKEPLQTGLILAGKCLAAFPTLREVSLRQEIVRGLFALLLTSPDAATQENAAAALAEGGGEAVQNRLIELLSNEQVDTHVRGRVANTLVRVSEHSIVPQLVTLLSSRQLDRYVRECIVEALGRLGEQSIVSQLVTLLSDKQLDPSVRKSIAEALVRVGERSIVSQLVALLAYEQMDANIRGSIAEALVRLGEHSIISQLVALLSHEQMDKYVRGSIAKALGNLGEWSVVPQLVTLLSNEQMDISVRKSIADALGNLGERSIVPQLVTLLSHEQMDANVRGSIADALGNLGERSIVPQLVTLLSNEQMDTNIRGSIAEALGSLGERSIVPQLVILLSNEQMDANVRGSVADALGSLGERSIVPQLVTLLSNEQVNANVRGSIAETLGRLGERSVALQLVALLSNEQLDKYVHGRIVETLGWLRERSIASQLVALLSNEQLDGYARGRIVETLGRLGERSVAPQLVMLLPNEQMDRYVRGRIAETLGWLGERAIVPQLVMLLPNEQVDTEVRGHIAEALGKLGERAIVPQLVMLLPNEQVDAEVRGHIAEALGKLGEKAIVPQLMALLSNEQVDADVHGRIAEALKRLTQ